MSGRARIGATLARRGDMEIALGIVIGFIVGMVCAASNDRITFVDGEPGDYKCRYKSKMYWMVEITKRGTEGKA